MREIDVKDQVLWHRFKEGDKKSFSLIYEQNIAGLLNYGMKICDDSIVLKDAIQDLFVELWNTRKNLSEVDGIKFYLFKSLRFKLIRARKKELSTKRHLILLRQNTEEQNDLSVEERMVGRETYETQTNLIEKAITGLSTRQQEVIQLRFYQGFTNEQIAELMQLNYQSVSNLVYTAIVRIREKLKGPVHINEYAVYR